MESHAAPTAGDEALGVHLIGNAHIDPVWIWDWREGFGEVWSTFRSALERIAEHDDVVFTASSPAYLAWVESHDPAMFDQIRAAVAAGRWRLVGGMWVEPDCNIPSGESLARQLLLGQRYLHRVFGAPATVGYNVDSFGHAAGLPTLLAAAGLSAYVMMRPERHEKELPATSFLWSDPGGRGILTYRIPLNYETESVAVLTEKVDAIGELGDAEGRPQMCFFGIGNHGGGPTRAMMAALDDARATRPRLLYSDPERFFGALRASTPSPDVVAGELQHHAVGCYSASAWVKAANRRSEVALQDAETLDALAASVASGPSGTEALRRAWEQLALCQFHDILAGTCSVQAYESVRRRFGYVETVADEVTTRAGYQVAHLVDTRVATIGAPERESFWAAGPEAAAPFVVVNPLAWTVHQMVRLPRHAARALDSGGQEIASQQVASGEATAYRTHTLVSLKLDPLGYEVVWLQGGSGSEGPDVIAGVLAASTEHHRVEVDAATGALRSVVERATSRELVGPGGIRPVVLRDDSDTWSHGVTRYDGNEVALTFEGGELVESGPLRVTLRLHFSCGESRLIEDVALESSPPRVRLRLRARWHEDRTLVKLVMPWNLGPGVTTTAGAAYSVQERPPTGGEEPFQGWLDVYDPAGDVGVAIATTHLYGYDATGPELRLTVLRNPVAADHGRGWARGRTLDYPTSDAGEHDATVEIVAHQGDWRRARLPLRAEELERTPIALAETYHAGPYTGRGSFLRLSPLDFAVVRQVKRAEDGGAVVLRLVEPWGERVTGEISGQVVNRRVSVTLEPFEVVTLLVPDDPDEAPRRVTLAELDLAGEEGEA
jgi:alpha-mannosidase